MHSTIHFYCETEVEQVLTRYGRMYIPSEDRIIGHSLRKYGEWAEHEIQSVSNHIHDGGIVIDVGANVGAHSLAFAARFPNTTVMAFEPQPLLHAMLCCNVISNRYSNIRAYNLACGEFESVFNCGPDYSQFEWNFGGVNIMTPAASSLDPLPIQMVRLDSLNYRQPVRFVKIDVEGMEPKVIEGMSTLMLRDRPIVYLEFTQIDNLQRVKNLFSKHRYSVFWHETSAYNRNNFSCDRENIWTRCESGILASPEERANEFHLPDVTGDETAVPTFHEPTFAFEGDSFFPCLSMNG